ncbi:MAG: YfiR family protein [Verrucomicrobiota bacterium]|nr:YfiR family protein [Verrucomicrobiota bacterium]
MGILLAAILASGAAAEPPQSQPKSEYALKAVFLYNFCRFIEWPKSAFASPTEPITIAVIGEDPFGPLLEEAVQGETLRGRSIQIQRYRKPDSIKHCHLLFISRSEAGRIEAILAAVAGKSVVTVGETDAFLDRGGMIALMAERNRIRLHINPSLLRAANLDVSSKLLRVAEVKP